MAYDVQVRPELIKAGYKDADIGYDEGRKMTTLKGQDFLGAGKYTNVAGSTFTDRMNFDNALKKYNQGQQPLQVRQQPTPQMSSITSAGGGQPTTPVNQADQRYNELLNMLYQQAQSPQPVDVNAIYGSPQWAAAQAQTQRGAQQGIRASQEALGSAGFGRSTTLGESAQRVQNDADEYLQTQVLPQLMAQEQTRKAQQFQDQFSVLDAMMKERDTTERNALEEARLTGRLMSDQDRTAQPLFDQLATLGQAWQTARSPEEKVSYSQQADRIRGQLEQMGVDPSLYDPNLSTEQRTAAGQGLGAQTMGGKEFDLKQQEYEIKLKELQDPNSVTNQINAMDLQIKQMELANLPEMQRQELAKIKKQIADIGVTRYKPQTDAQKQYDLEKVNKIKAEIAKIENGSAEPTDYTNDPVFIGAYADASGGGLTSAEITGDAKSIINDLGKKAYDELLATARAYEKLKSGETDY